MKRAQLVKKLKKDHVYTFKVCVILPDGKKIDVHKVRSVIFDCIVDQEETRPKEGKWKRKTRSYVRYVCGNEDKKNNWSFPGIQSHMPIKNILKVWDKGHCRNHVDAESAQEWREKHLAVRVKDLGWEFVGMQDWVFDTPSLNVRGKR